MTFSIIAAVGKNGELGLNNKLLWHIPEDLRWFKQHTLNKVVVYGRKTYESLPIPYLPGRINVVLTSDKSYKPHPNVIVKHSVGDVLHEFSNEREVMVCGGSNIYEQFLPYSNKIYLTKVNHTFDADTYFPHVEWDGWVQYFENKRRNDNGFEYSFHVYKKPLK